MNWYQDINPFTAKLFNLNFHPLEAVSPQLQVVENYSDLTKWTFYRCHVQKLVFDVVIQKRIYPGPAVKGLND